MPDMATVLLTHLRDIANDIHRQPVDGLTDQEREICLAGCGFSVGFEEGLVVGLLAPMAAEQWLTHIFEDIHGADPEYTPQAVLDHLGDLIAGSRQGETN